jgi:hypothetical protein
MRPGTMRRCLAAVATLAAVGSATWVPAPAAEQFTGTKYSQRELREVADRITVDTSWLPGGNEVLSKWYVDVEANAVTVGLTEVTPAARAAARRTFGDRVRLVVAERAHATSSRSIDFAPWAGGDRIRTPKGTCTSGFAIHRIADPTDQRMVTAGHCADLGALVTNGGESIGTVVEKNSSPDGLDVAYIGGQQYSPFIYLGDPSSTVGRTTVGTSTLVKGLGICTSGSLTGQNCAGSVGGTDVCVNFDDLGPKCHLAEAKTTDGSALSQKGDSGGPVVRMSAENGVIVVGMIVGGTNDNRFVLFHPFDQVVPAGWRVSTG